MAPHLVDLDLDLARVTTLLRSGGSAPQEVSSQ